MNEVLTLFELNSLVHEVIEDNFDEQYWVVGELSDVSTPAFGGSQRTFSTVDISMAKLSRKMKRATELWLVQG